MDRKISASQRFKKLKRNLVEAIPRFPNNKATLQALQDMKFVPLLVTYLSWKVRLVEQRPRRVVRTKVLRSHEAFPRLRPNIDAFLAAVEAGEDLIPYLSSAAASEGFTPPDPNHEKGLWADKDLLLNVMGFHHFHLGMTTDPSGYYARTNEVLFALVGRDQFEVIGLFTHEAFKRSSPGHLTPERRSLWAAYEKRLAEDRVPGEIYIGGMAGMGIAGSGVPVAIVETAFQYVRRIEEYEKNLESFEFAKTLYSDGNIPAKSKFVWGFDHLDLVLIDAGASQLVRIARGLGSD
ncbi:hypothetical protein IFT80_21245 [Pseudomonas sp. CFBP 8771]|uniref:hypothetical protein n=1 Tax=Pseudomonas sp. CFBP 8771 TaxID=2775285 RepID=UPI0017852C4F|nr:hypothetical protein [Pseudomonas sp. CFBP 8771]MBD8605166.1 hypothetical protein [Pseudomonas sp. CFBP 8771]